MVEATQVRFAKPPLSEVVMGVQFDTPQGYSSVYAGEVWELFKLDYPGIQQHPPIEPAFEVFASPTASGTGMVFQGRFFSASDGNLIVHPRYWFVSKDGNDLIQFQSDRLLHNWRDVGGGAGHYPHYEALKEKFATELGLLNDYAARFVRGGLRISQVEISYVNHIYGSGNTLPVAEDWLKFIRVGNRQPESFGGAFREVVRREGHPPGRLHCETTTTTDTSGRRHIALTLTYRGAPKSPDLQAAFDFLDFGHDTVLRTFVDITTEKAHSEWGMSK